MSSFPVNPNQTSSISKNNKLFQKKTSCVSHFDHIAPIEENYRSSNIDPQTQDINEENSSPNAIRV